MKTATAVSNPNGANRHIEHPATMVAWVSSPALVDRQTAAYLLGVNDQVIQQIIDAGGVELVEQNGQVLIDRLSLREFWEIYWELPDYAPALQ